MKPQVLVIPSTAVLSQDQHNGNISMKGERVQSTYVKQEPEETSEFDRTSPPVEPGQYQSHPRKKMMAKWMTVNDENGVDRRPLSPRDNDDHSPGRTSKSPLTLPPSGMTVIPPDPRKWTASHVGRWLEAVSAKYSLVINKNDFLMNGRALCLMKREGFVNRVPEKGEILYEDFRSRLRHFLSACRKRVRTTFASPGMVPPGRAPSFPPPSSQQQQPAAAPLPNQPNLSSQWIAPFSALRSKFVGAGPNATPGTPPALHPTLSEHKPSGCLLHPTPPFQMPHSVSNIRKPSSVVDASSTSQAEPSPMAAAALRQYHGAFSAHFPLSPFPQAQPFGVHAAPPSLHTAPPVSSSQSRTSTATQPPSSTRPSTHDSPGTGICPVHGSNSAAGVSGPHPNQQQAFYPYLQPSPYYQFVPLYRTMKVVGHFQPLPYRLPRPNTQQTSSRSATSSPLDQSSAGATSSNQSPARTTSQPPNQPQALDLSLPSNKVSRPAPDTGDDDACSNKENDKKKIKVEPSDP